MDNKKLRNKIIIMELLLIAFSFLVGWAFTIATLKANVKVEDKQVDIIITTMGLDFIHRATIE